jgi:hypothetical protein
MKLWRAVCVRFSWLIGVTVVGAVGGAFVGCGGSKPTTPQCALNSDCVAPLVCALGYCVKQCNLSSDCPNGERCVIVGGASASGGAAGGGNSGGTSGAAGGESGSAGGMSGGPGGVGGDAGGTSGSAGGTSGSAGGTSGSAGGTSGSAGGMSGSAGGMSGSAGGMSGSAGGSGGQIVGTACQAPEIASCTYNSMCHSPLVCGNDHQCRDMCETDVDCPMGQRCTSITKLCADPTVDTDYNAAINDFVVNDAGVGIPQGGNSGTANGGAAGGGATSGGGGKGGKGGNGAGGSASVNVCPSPQTSFGNIAIGDSNSAFTSGIGVRDGNQLFVFSGYVTPTSDAGAGGSSGDAGDAGNFIYVQAFDEATGNSKGPAAPLLKTADGPFFGVNDVSVAPTGEIVVLHTRGTAGNSFSAINLYASFLGPTSNTDGGVAGLQVVRTVQLESVDMAFPHAIWSVSNQAFVISWKYATTNWFTRVRKFTPGGQSAGGDTSVVPTPSGTNDNYGWDEGQVGTSGNLIGAAYRNDSSAIPTLTILDGDGLQVGDLLALSALGVSGWVSSGGTTNGFVTLFNNYSNVVGVFVPTSGAHDVLTDGGTTVDAGDGGVARLFSTFSFPSNASTAKMVSDDTGGPGGVGAVLLESNGASFHYVTADGSKHLAPGTVISSAHGAEIGLSNYLGSFAVSLYDSTTHATQLVASGCSQ